MNEMLEFHLSFLLSDLRPDIEPDVMLKFFWTDRTGASQSLFY